MFSKADKINPVPVSRNCENKVQAFFQKAGEDYTNAEQQPGSFFMPSVQAKLTISSPDDAQEKEADSIANRVMTMPEQVTQADTKQEDRSLSRKTNSEDLHQTDNSEGDKQAEVSVIQRSDLMSGKESVTNSFNLLQRSGRDPPGTLMNFEDKLHSSKGNGSPLSESTKQFMQSRFNTDFSGVRIHTGAYAETMSESIHAHAFTHGEDIYFNSGRYSPDTSTGRILLAHELTHTIQQGAVEPGKSENHIRESHEKNETLQRVPSGPVPQLTQAVEKAKSKEGKVNAGKEPCSHFAIVESATGSTVRTVNGNTSGEDNLGGQIQTREHPISNWTAFFNPLQVMQGTLGNGEGSAEEKTRSLRELRRELFHVDRSSEEEKTDKNFTGEKSAEQGNPELSDWSVNKDGVLHVNQKNQSNTPLLRLKENNEQHGLKEEEKEKEETLPSSEEITVGKQHDVIQNGWFDRAISFVNNAIDYVAEGLEAGKRMLLTQARDFVMAIPGYRALRVVLGEDPITGEAVERNGRNFIAAAFDIIPGGRQLHDKLTELGALEEAVGWVDNGIEAIQNLVANVVSRVENFWNGLTLERLANPMQIFREAGNIIHDTISEVINFAIRTGTELLEIVKRWLLTQVVSFIRERTNAYPLLTVILGRDPITDAEVERNGTNILNAMLELGGETGRQQRTQMQETGTFARAAAWIDRGIHVFSNLYQTIRNNFRLIWSIVSIDALMHPVEKFTEIYNTFATPVREVIQFVAETARIILQFIKEVLMRRLSAWAREQRGYYLLTVILGSDPFTGEVVERNTENIIHGFMSLMDGGDAQFEQMKQTGAIARATQRIDAAVARLNMTPAFIIRLFMSLWLSFSLTDLIHPIDAFRRILDRLAQPILRLIAFVVEIVKIVVLVILEIMNFPFDLINNIIARTIASFHLIKADPIGFLKNLLRAIKEGFIRFFNNILQHLINGLVGWLTMELRDAGVPPLNDLSLRGIIGWVLAVLGISMERIWEKLARHPRIGPARVARIRGMISTLEGIWTFIRDVQERGVAAIWERIAEQLSNLWNTVLEAVRNWIMERIITQVTARLLSMLDPTGIMAVVNSCIAIYRAIQSFIRYVRQMLEIVNSFVEGVAEIASGSIGRAAGFLERTLARGVPIVIGFLANQVGLSGIGRRIGEMIERVRAMVDRALDWLVNRAVDLGGRLLDMGRAAVGRVMNWLGLRKNFVATNGESHELYFEGTNDESAELWIASRNPMRYTAFLANINTVNDPAKATKKQEAIELLAQVQFAKRQPLSPGIPEEQARAAKYDLINIKIIALSVPTAHLFGGPLRPLEFAFGSANAVGFANNMTIRNLNKNNRPPVGGPPAITNDFYRKLDLRRNGSTTYYIKGHLLNGYLGGTGSDFRNLTPLSREGNGNHERQVESKVVEQVDAGKTVEYLVTPTSGSARTISDSQMDNAGIDVTDRGTIREIVTAENFVPEGLTCVANVLNDTTGEPESSIVNTTVPNPIDTNLSNYEI